MGAIFETLNRERNEWMSAPFVLTIVLKIEIKTNKTGVINEYGQTVSLCVRHLSSNICALMAKLIYHFSGFTHS